MFDKNSTGQSLTSSQRLGSAATTTTTTGNPPANVDQIKIIGGNPDAESQKVMQAALADVDNYWSATFSKVFKKQYTTIKGGFYAVSEGQQAPCMDQGQSLDGNAFYCPDKDLVAWDATGLIPQLVKNYGPLGLGIVIAHEWGHAIQTRAGVSGPTILLEQQADCFAGSWVANARADGDQYFKVDDQSLDLALAAMVAFKDPVGTDPNQSNAHGTAFDRIRAFQDGVESGPTACAQYSVQSLEKVLVATPFTSQTDYDNQGNLPLQQAYDLMNADLKDFWTKDWSTFAKGSFSVPDVKVYGTGLQQGTDQNGQGGTNTAKPSCKAPINIADGVFYCPQSNVIALQSDGAAITAYNKIGDNALGEILGTGYALSALHQIRGALTASAKLTRTADCLSGVWTKSVYDGDRAQSSDNALSLSPGDLDEAVGALLSTSDNSKSSTTGSGFDRVLAYRSGFTNGAKACAV